MLSPDLTNTESVLLSSTTMTDPKKTEESQDPSKENDTNLYLSEGPFTNHRIISKAPPATIFNNNNNNNVALKSPMYKPLEEPAMFDPTSITFHGLNLFCCAVCRSIVGDSYSAEIYLENINQITLQKMLHVELEEESIKNCMDKASIEFGCTFLPVKCKHCKQLVARFFITTNRQLDCLRDKYTLILGALTVYEPSCYSEEKSLLPPPPISESKEDGIMMMMADQQTLNNTSFVDLTTFNQVRDRVNSLEMEVVKLQRFVLCLLDKQRELENVLTGRESTTISEEEPIVVKKKPGRKPQPKSQITDASC